MSDLIKDIGTGNQKLKIMTTEFTYYSGYIPELRQKDIIANYRDVFKEHFVDEFYDNEFTPLDNIQIRIDHLYNHEKISGNIAITAEVHRGQLSEVQILKNREFVKEHKLAEQISDSISEREKQSSEKFDAAYLQAVLNSPNQRSWSVEQVTQSQIEQFVHSVIVTDNVSLNGYFARMLSHSYYQPTSGGCLFMNRVEGVDSLQEWNSFIEFNTGDYYSEESPYCYFDKVITLPRLLYRNFVPKLYFNFCKTNGFQCDY